MKIQQLCPLFQGKDRRYARQWKLRSHIRLEGEAPSESRVKTPRSRRPVRRPSRAETGAHLTIGLMCIAGLLREEGQAPDLARIGYLHQELDSEIELFDLQILIRTMRLRY